MNENGIVARAPASYGQERIWLAAQLAPEATYPVLSWVALPRGVDLSVVDAALTTLSERHEALRSSLEWVDSELHQVVHARTRLDLTEVTVDLTGEQAMLADPRALDLPLAAFDTARAPLWRAVLLRCSDADHLLVVAHHTIFDAGSHALLSRELTAVLAGEDADLDDPGPQPADVAAWQRRRAAEGGLDAGLAYWQRTLSELAPTHAIPLDGVRSDRSGQPGQDLFTRLPEGTSRRARDYGHSCGSTEFMVSFAAFAATVAAAGGVADVVVGVPATERDVTGAETIGMYVNTLVLRVQVDPRRSFADLVAQVRSVLLDAWDHTDVPLQLLTETVPFHRVHGASPLYQLGFNHLGSTGLGRSLGHAKDELFVELSDDDVRVEYRTDLFLATHVAQIVDLYGRLFAAALEEPDRPLTELLGTDEVAEFERGDAAPSNGPAVQELLSSAADPRSAAVLWSAGSLSYEQLEDWSQGVASELRTRAARRGDVVSIDGAPGPHLPAAVLGVLRAGCAVLPIAPGTPAAREDLMRARVGVSISLDAHAVTAVRRPAADGSTVEVGVDDAAYVLFTSGSTGEPKAVVNTRGGLAQRLDWMQAVYRIGPGDVVLHKTPTSFDVSMWELLWPVRNGAAVALMEPGKHRDPWRIVSAASEYGVTHLHFVPSMLSAFLDAGAVLPDSVRQVVCSGETLTSTLAQEFSRTHPNVALDNLYGPTEAAIDVTRDPHEAPAPPTLGRPVPGTTLRVLGEDLTRCPVGVVGDLHIAGAQLARGYGGDPGRTAAAFVPDPFGHPGQRMYATGDRARWLPDGRLDYVGRSDSQVKIRGQRIETGEVTAALLSASGVREAVTVLRHDARGAGFLSAYVTGAHDLDTGQVRAHLHALLPDGFVPDRLTRLASLPVTAHGKVDVAALPEPQSDEVPNIDAVAATPTERLVADAFDHVLERSVGPEDDFFALGGNSLTAVRLVGLLRAAAAVEMPVSSVFAAPTPRGLAREVERLIEAEVMAMSDEDVAAALEVRP